MITENESGKNQINAAPSKNFFIKMLTRDIGLVDCILDLVDNSVDSFIRNNNLDVTQPLLGDRMRHAAAKNKAYININFTGNRFSIEDNCGGISIDDAKNYVFRFGYHHEEKRTTGLGVYGIGMKRAFFKMGNKIDFISITKNEEFSVEIDVEKWKQEENNWHFKFSDAKPYPKPIGTKNTGTVIEISELHEEIAGRLKLKVVQNEISEKIANTYALFIDHGVEIKVNGVALASKLPKLGISSNVTSARKQFVKNGVDVLIIIGVTPPSNKTPGGWYIFCNGRMVVEADKTPLTGWGRDLPQFHTKFNHFVGYLYFHSPDVFKLPWRTTKNGVEAESEIYLTALNEMTLLAKPVTDLFTKIYAPDEDRAESKALFRNLREKSTQQIPIKTTLFRVNDSKLKESQEVNITYRRNVEEVERIRRKLAKPRMPATKVGQYTFDYFIKNHCEQ
ncbi:MAG: ATP-binding protein [Candidatus Omnitrophota bacterium]